MKNNNNWVIKLNSDGKKNPNMYLICLTLLFPAPPLLIIDCVLVYISGKQYFEYFDLLRTFIKIMYKRLEKSS